MKRILLFARDPGGANTIIPLVKPLKEKGYKVSLYGRDRALDRYKLFGLKEDCFEQKIDKITEQNILNFLKYENPDLIITGTSADDKTEKYLWQCARRLNIPSFAILDQWVNYGIRFSKYDVADLKEYEKNKSHDFLPSKILVMDDYAKKEMMQEGIDKDKIVVTGQPYFDFLMQQKNNLTVCRSDDFIITFASEAILKIYKTKEIWGYTEQTILNEILLVLKKINISKKILFIIKPHPKEDIDIYKKLLISFKHPKIKLRLETNLSSWDLIKKSDLVCGMTSMFLLESVLLGKQILSIQIGLRKKDPFILSRRGFVKTVLTRQNLIQKLQQVIFDKSSVCDFDIFKNSIHNVISYVDKVLNGDSNEWDSKKLSEKQI